MTRFVITTNFRHLLLNDLVTPAHFYEFSLFAGYCMNARQSCKKYKSLVTKFKHKKTIAFEYRFGVSISSFDFDVEFRNFEVRFWVSILSFDFDVEFRGSKFRVSILSFDVEFRNFEFRFWASISNFEVRFWVSPILYQLWYYIMLLYQLYIYFSAVLLRATRFHNSYVRQVITVRFHLHPQLLHLPTKTILTKKSENMELIRISG